MRDTELYRHLLGVVAPWGVDRVELSVRDGRVDVWVQHADRTRFACPECDTALSVYDHSAERAWRHLDSCAFLTFLHASPPRVRCPEHGVRQVRLPWAEPHSRFTTLFERLAIDVLAACDVAAAAGLLRVSWDEAWHLMDRAVARGLATKPLAVPAHVGVDEKAAGKGQDYINVVSVLQAPRLGRQTLQTLVLLGHPLAAEADHRSGEDAEAPRGGVAVLLRAPHHQRRRGGPQLPHPGDQGLCPRLPQPGALQDRDLLPSRRIAALPGHTMTHGLPGRAHITRPSRPS